MKDIDEKEKSTKSGRYLDRLPETVYVIFWAYSMFCLGDAMMQFAFWESSWIDWKKITGFPKLKNMDEYFDESSPKSTMDEKLLLNFGLLCLFGFQHSFMARKYFKETIMPVSERLTRSLYIYATAFALDTLINNWEPMPEKIYDITKTHPLLSSFITCLHFSTNIIISISAFSIDGWHFLGYKQAVKIEVNDTF